MTYTAADSVLARLARRIRAAVAHRVIVRSRPLARVEGYAGVR